MRTIGKTFVFAILLASMAVAGANPGGGEADAPLFNTIKAFRFEPQADGVRVVLETGYPVLNYTHYDSDPETYAVDLPDVVLGEGVPAVLPVNGTNVADARLVEVSRTRSRSLYRLEIRKAYLATAQVSARDGMVTVLVTGGVLADQEPRPAAQPVSASPSVAAPVAQPAAAAAPKAAGESKAANALAPAQRIKGIRMEGAGSVAIELDGSAKYQHFTLSAPDRIVLDVHGITASKLGDLPSGGTVNRIRISQYATSPEKVTRIVLDLSRAVRYDVLREGHILRVVLNDGATSDLVSAPQAEPVTETAPLEMAQAAPAVTAPADPQPVAMAAAAPAPGVVQPVAFNDATPILFEGAPPENGGAGETVLGGVPMSFSDKTISGDAGKYTGDLISIDFNNMDIRDILRFFADISNLNFVVNPTVRANVTIRLRDVPWDQALEIILRNHGYDYVFENNVVWVAKTSDIVKKIAERNALEDARQQAEQPETVVIRVGYAQVKDVEKAFKELVKSMNSAAGGKGSKKFKANIVTDARTNSIIVEDVPSRLKQFQEMARLLDTPTPQILIEARFVEAQSNWSQNLGFRFQMFGADHTRDDANPSYQGFLGASPDGSLAIDGDEVVQTPGIVTAFRFLDAAGILGLDIALNAFESQGKVRVISAPRLVTQNNNPASIKVGTVIYIATGTSTALGLTPVSAVLGLDVTPQVTADGYVVLEAKVSNSSPGSTGGSTVSVNTREINTILRVKDGGTAVIGGVFTSSEDISMSGVPFLSKIPVLGWLFKNRAKSRNNTELIIFLTPKVIQ